LPRCRDRSPCATANVISPFHQEPFSEAFPTVISVPLENPCCLGVPFQSILRNNKQRTAWSISRLPWLRRSHRRSSACHRSRITRGQDRPFPQNGDAVQSNKNVSSGSSGVGTPTQHERASRAIIASDDRALRVQQFCHHLPDYAHRLTGQLHSSGCLFNRFTIRL